MTKEWGSSVTITGKGTLVVNKDKEWLIKLLKKEKNVGYIEKDIEEQLEYNFIAKMS